MVSETPPADGGPPSNGGSGGRRKRPAPTIDLEATEVSTQPPETSEPGPAPQQDPHAEEAREPFIPPPPERPHLHPGQPPGGPESDRLRAVPPRGSLWPMIGAVAAGAGGVLVGFLLLWIVGATPGARQETVDLSPRLASIEAQLRDLATRAVLSTAPTMDQKAIEGLSSRLDKLEAAVNAPRLPVTDPAVLNRIGAVDSGVKTLSDNVATMARRNDETAAATRGRLDALAASVADVEKKEREAGSDKAVRLAVTAGALRAAVERGQPFTAELAAVKSLTQDAGALAALEPFAVVGVPDDAALGRELSALIQPMLKAAAPQANEGSILERLQANAQKLVRIRPVDAPAGDDPTALLARIEFKAARADIAGALADIGKLPTDARVKAQAWIAKVEARDKSFAASRRFHADAIAALKIP